MADRRGGGACSALFGTAALSPARSDERPRGSPPSSALGAGAVRVSAVLLGAPWRLIIALIRDRVTIDDIENHLMCVFAIICTSSLGTFLFRPLSI